MSGYKTVWQGQIVKLELIGVKYHVRFTWNKTRYRVATNITKGDRITEHEAMVFALKVEKSIINKVFQGDTSIFKPTPKLKKPKRVKKEVVKKPVALLDRFEEFLQSKQMEVRASTFKFKYIQHKRFVTGILGNATDIKGFTVQQARTLVLELQKTLNPRTVKAKIYVLASFWSWLQMDSIEAEYNPWSKAMSMVLKDSVIVKPEPFAKHERDAILKTFQDTPLLRKYYPVILFMFSTGCRPSEAFALTYGDIDQNRSVIKINKGAVRGIIDDTKTGKHREIPLTNAMSKALEIAAEGREMYSDSLCFPNPVDGKLLSDHMLGQRWRKALKIANVPYRKMYSTRHTFITEALLQGGNPAKIAQIVGNSPDIIYKHYANITANLQDAMPIL